MDIMGIEHASVSRIGRGSNGPLRRIASYEPRK